MKLNSKQIESLIFVMNLSEDFFQEAIRQGMPTDWGSGLRAKKLINIARETVGVLKQEFKNNE